MNNEIIVNINQSEQSYPIFVATDSVEDFAQRLREKTGNRNFLVVISARVNKLFGKALGFNKAEKLVLKDGEKQKNIKTYKKIITRMGKQGLSRGDVLIAVGGGVVGDLAGFAASTYMRGISLIQVPSTLLASVDSSVGGKTAINTSFGKNLVGTFFQPESVFINLNFLKTLDKKQFQSGIAEIIKYAFIEKSCQSDQAFGLLEFLDANFHKINSRELAHLEKVINICISLKKSVVEKDEKENGLRKILNFGHTYAHALEHLTHYNKISHGLAVVYGMDFAFKKSLETNRTSKAYFDKFLEIISKFEIKLLNQFNEKKLQELMHRDKKCTKGKVVFLLPTQKATVEEFDDIL